MKTLKKILSVIMIIFFPLGIIYCLFHCLGKDFICFLGSIFMCAIGVLIGIYLVEPQILINLWEKVLQVFQLFVN